MTTKLNFIVSACAVFNCTPSVVLSAVAGRPSVHPETVKEIKKWADNSCNATAKEWKSFAAACDVKIAQDLLWSMVSGADIKVVPLP